MGAPPVANIVFIGPPGAGKSTVAHVVAESIPLDIISTGVLLRAEIASGSTLGQQIAAAIDHGDLVTDEVMHRVLGAYIATLPATHGFILDGYPRTLSQAQYLPTMLAQYGRRLTFVALLDITDAVVVQRLSGRRMCVTPHDTFPVHIDDPASLAECQMHGGTLEMRPDDAPDIVLHRVAVYHETTQPLIAYFDQLQLLKRIDANSPADVVAKTILGLVV
ncbi:MAG: adenylate kinase [Chloroflexia bacterium]|nr:adenylate kinase [Chloroflexia bacterium]